MNFEFHNPNLLWLLLILPVLAILRSSAGKGASVIFSNIGIAKLASMRARKSSRGILFFLRLLCLALVIIALARPRLGSGYVQREESGIDIVVAIDVSGSMRALDLSESMRNRLTRLDAVKIVVDDFIKKRPNDRIGVVIFGAEDFELSPITLDHDWLLKNLARVELGIINGDATAIGSAIVRGANMLKVLEDSKSKVIILLTDGDNNAGEISPLAAAEAAGALDIKIHTISAGRESGGLKTLQEISKLTQGESFKAYNLTKLKDIYTEIDKLETTKVQLEHFTSYEELFQYLLFASALILTLELLLANTIYRRIP